MTNLAHLPPTQEQGKRFNLRLRMVARQDMHFMRTKDACLAWKHERSPGAKMTAKLNGRHADRLLLRELRCLSQDNEPRAIYLQSSPSF